MFLRKERIEQFLLNLYQMAEGTTRQDVQIASLGNKIAMEDPELDEVAGYLKEEGLIGYLSFTAVNLTHKGRKEAERIMEESYSQTKHRVLEAIADMARMSRVIPYHGLKERLKMSDSDLAGYCNGLDEQGLIDFPGGDIIQMRDAGWEALEPKPPAKPHIVINNPQNSPMSFGDNSNQTVNYNNQSLAEVLPAIAQLIEDVRKYDFDTRDDVLQELEKVHTLAKGEVNAGVWQLIQSRLLTVKTTLEIAKIGAGTLPYWPAVWNFFFQ